MSSRFNRRLATLAIACVAILPLLLAEVPRQSVQVVTTEHADFAPGGTIRVSNSAGELNIEAWDEPRVELTVTRSNYVRDTAEAHERAARALNEVHVSFVKNGADLAVSTTRRKSLGINLDYRLMVPRNSKLVIVHHTGDVIIDGVDGDIDARSTAGDIELQLPPGGSYAIDAAVGSGGIRSAFAGRHKHKLLSGETYLETSQAGARQIHLRLGIGDIEIQKMTPYPVESGNPAGTPDRFFPNAKPSPGL